MFAGIGLAVIVLIPHAPLLRRAAAPVSDANGRMELRRGRMQGPSLSCHVYIVEGRADVAFAAATRWCASDSQPRSWRAASSGVWP
jgi:hypothetical protein